MRIFPIFFFGYLKANVPEQNLLVVTVATEATDGFIRWEESVKRHNLDYKVRPLDLQFLLEIAIIFSDFVDYFTLIRPKVTYFRNQTDFWKIRPIADF